MRLLRLLLAVIVSSCALVAVTGGPAVACSCAWSRPAQFVTAAEEILIGQLVGMEDPPPQAIMSSADPIAYTVEVDAVYRGDVGPVVVLESAGSGASCGLENMELGRRYVFFLDVEGDNRSASLCGGTGPATPRLERAVERLTGPPTTPAPETTVEQAAGPGPRTVRTDDDVPAESAVPAWAIGAGGLGVALLAGGVVWLRRRSG